MGDSRSASGNVSASATAMAWFARACEPTVSVAAIFSVVTTYMLGHLGAVRPGSLQAIPNTGEKHPAWVVSSAPA